MSCVYTIPSIQSVTPENVVDAGLKATNALQSDKAMRLFKTLEKNKVTGDTFWNKVQNDLQIPREQIELLKGYNTTDRDQLLTNMLADYSYAVEINTAKEKLTGKIAEEEGMYVKEENGKYYLIDSAYSTKNEITKSEYEDFNNDKQIPTKHYSNLTVPGGTNYTENEIATPAITPSIKGHAQFATENGIGWFRSDDKTINDRIVPDEEKERLIQQLEAAGQQISLDNIYGEGTPTKTRRILEVQSDLFQKGRDKSSLVESTKNTLKDEFSVSQEPDDTWSVFRNNPFEVIKSKLESKEQAKQEILKFTGKNDQNQFLQLLNKDNNWVTFFTKSIIQDSAKKGYEKVLFPSGNTASKVEGHTTLEEFKKQKEDRLKKLGDIADSLDELIISETGYGSFVIKDKNGFTPEARFRLNDNFDTKKLAQKRINEELKDLENEANQLKEELERTEREGFGALKPIYNFYENTVTNILNKQYGKENVKQVTDEYGNTWNELTISPNRDIQKVLFSPKTFTNTEIKQIFSSVSAIPGSEDMSDEQLIEKVKELSKDRFVDINLFDPYQETAYTNVIFSEVVNKLGTLKPGEKININANRLFAEIKAAFTNDYKRLNFLAEKVKTEEEYNSLKTNEKILEKYPEIKTLSFDQLNTTIEQFKNVTDGENWDKFIDLARVKLNKVGLRIKDNMLEDFGLSHEYFQTLIEEDQDGRDDDEIEESDRETNESFEDGRAFRINAKDTASTRVKLFFSTIPSTEKNVFGKTDFVSYDQIFEDLLNIGANLTKVNYKNLQDAIIDKTKAKPYLKNVSYRLAELAKDKNVKLLNEIMTVINKAYTDHVLVLWNGGKSENGVTVKIISSNRQSVIRQIKADWLESQKNSSIISKDEIGDLVINKNKVNELSASLKQVDKSKDGTEKLYWMQQFFNAIGVEITPQMLDYIKDKANSGFFKMMGSKSLSAMFRPNGVFDRILRTYAKDPTGNGDSKYDDINNAMNHERVFDKFAEIYFEFHGDKYQAGTFRNGENKTIYSYIQPSYIETVKKKLGNGRVFLDRLASRSFSKSSEVVDQLIKNLDKDSNLFTYRIRYADSLKKDKEDKAGKVRKNMSPKEMVFDAMAKHQNGTGTTGFYNMFTLSDKTVTPIIEITKDNISPATDIAISKNDDIKLRDSFKYKKAFTDKLYRLVQSEVDRMIDYARYADKETLAINNFDKSNKLFYLFPTLNDTADARLNQIKENIFIGIAPTQEDIEHMGNIVTDSFKNSVMTSFVEMMDAGLIVKTETIDNTGDKPKTIIGFNFPFFNTEYMDRYKNLSPRHQAIAVITDFKYNYTRAQVNTLQVLGADPSLFYKTKINKPYEDLTNEDRDSIVKSSIDNFSKRAAMFIAPGSQGVFEWLDMNGKPVDKTTYNTITISDVVKNNDFFKNVVTTDAQELVTLQEHVDRLMSEGRIELETWQRITDKIESNKGKFYKLDNEDLSLVLQPTKPVHSSNTDIDGFTKIDYIKSSTYPMIPEVIQGTELDKLRKLMENNNIQSAPFDTGKKVGSPGKALEVFDSEGNYVEPTALQLKKVTQSLNREGLRTQQEIPAQKDEINVVSQMDRQLFEGILDIKNFIIKDKSFNGRDFKKLKENVRIALFYKNRDELQDRLNIKINKAGNIVFKNQTALANLLKEEAIDRDFDVNDIKGIKVNENGNLVIPIYLMAKGKRFEGLVTSIFSKLVKLKLPGTSLVQVSSVGTKISESELTEAVKNEIIYTESYDPTKGLQYIRKGKNGVVEAAQIFVSQFIKDDNGRLIDLKKLASQNENGRWILDPTKVSKDVLQLIGARIPNQLHSSMLPIEVAGFLPSYMENTVIVPDGITAQMGSDFDVDKLYSYMSVNNFTYSTKNQTAISKLNNEITTLKKDYSDKVDALFESVYPKNIRETISQLKESKNKYIEKLKYTNISQKEREKKQKRIDGINKILSDVYADAMGKTDEQRLQKANQEKYKLKDVLVKNIDNIKEQISELQSDIEGISSQKYSLEGYDDSYQSLEKMSDSELLQMYKDIHWSVLTHPKVFDKITRALDFPDIESESAIFEKNGLIPTDQNFMPMDYRTQIQTFIDNRSGKTGTGIFAQLISFLAEHQDKEVISGFVDQNGNKNIKFIPLLKDNGSKLDLYKLTQEGKTTITVDGKSQTRTKTDNTSMMLTESVDNGNKKNLYKFNFSVEAMTPIRALISLSSDKNEIADIRYATRLMPQQIIKEFNDEVENRKDSLNDNTFVDKFKLADEFYKKYSGLLSKKLSSEYSSNIVPDTIFSPASLLQNLIDGKEFGKDLLKQKIAGKTLSDVNQAKLDKYILDQLSALKLYRKLDTIGQALSSVMTATNVISSGVGNSLFAIADKQRKLAVLGESKSFLNLSQLLGKVNDRNMLVEPEGQAGHAMSVALEFGVKVLSELAPIHFDKSFSKFREKVVRERSSTGSIANYGKQKYITLSEDLMNNLYSYIFTSPKFGIIKNVDGERERLLFGANGEKPLAKRIEDAKKSHPFLEKNYFINRLRLISPATGKFGDPHLIEYRAPFSQDIDEMANNKGFLELILSGDKELINIAKDLIGYSYVTGYGQSYGSYLKYIPIELFMLNKDYMNSIQKFPAFLDQDNLNPLDDYNGFYKQYIQNNPEYARRVPYKVYKALFSKKLADDGIIVLDEEVKEHESLMVQKGPDEGTGTKFPNFLSYYDRIAKKWFLFQKVGGLQTSEDAGNSILDSSAYKRINTLGNDKVSEYNIDNSNVKSVFFNNLLYKDKMEILAKNPNNPYYSVKVPNVDQFRRQISMGEDATQHIGFNIDGKSKIVKLNIEAFKDKHNTNTYNSNDVIMVSGNSLTDITPLEIDQKQLDGLQTAKAYRTLDSIFDELYKPLIDKGIKVGSSFVFTNFTGVDQITKKYLTENGYKENPTELGYSKYTKGDAAITPSIDMESTDPEDNITFGADFDAPSMDVADFFSGTVASESESSVDDDVKEGSGLFGMGFAEEEDRPNFIPSVSDEGANIIESDEDVVTKYANPNKTNTLESVVTRIAKNTNNEFYKTTIEVLQKIGFPKTTLIINKAINNPGEFDTAQNVMIINPDLALTDNPSRSRAENLEDVIMHETIHSYTADVLSRIAENDKTLTENERVFGTSLKALYNTVVDKVSKDPEHSGKLKDVINKMSNKSSYLTPSDKSMYYGLTSVDEFASMIMTDASFQKFMNNISVDNKTNITAFERFKQLLLKLFRTLAERLNISIKSGSALEQGVNDVFNLISSRPIDRAAEGPKLESISTRNLENYSLENQCK